MKLMIYLIKLLFKVQTKNNYPNIKQTGPDPRIPGEPKLPSEPTLTRTLSATCISWLFHPLQLQLQLQALSLSLSFIFFHLNHFGISFVIFSFHNPSGHCFSRVSAAVPTPGTGDWRRWPFGLPCSSFAGDLLDWTGPPREREIDELFSGFASNLSLLGLGILFHFWNVV